MAKKKIEQEVFEESIQLSSLDDIMADRFASYAKYVIQDRAIPDVRDGLKPVQRRILFAMYNSGNTHSKPTRKCAHTVGEVMGKYHPHGDSSIYNALARMSQVWKVRVPLIDFQGNNGSIDGDGPAAYRYTESRLSEVAEELLKDIDKQTVDMQLTFDDTNFEPMVLPARFPNLYVNGSEGIAVAVATDIPPHNLNEVSEAIIYRLTHSKCTSLDLMQFVKGPDFPTGGIVYQSEGLTSIYETGRGRIEIVSKCEIVEGKNGTQIIVTEIPYGVQKSDIVYEIDKIRADKVIDGILEVRDESDYSELRIAIDLKKDVKSDVILTYLLNKTHLQVGYSANIVAIVNNRPRTLSLLDYADAYVEHQRDVITRRAKFDLAKQSKRIHIVDGLIKVVSIVDEVVKTIRASSDKADAKRNISSKFGFSEEQAEAIVTLQLYKLSNTDITTLMNEQKALKESIEDLKEILGNDKKLDKVIIQDLKAISTKYGTPRKTLIAEKEEKAAIDKRDLIAKEDVMIAVTRDGYFKRSSLKSYKSSEGALPGMKKGDAIMGIAEANTVDFLLAFTSAGNYCYIPVHELYDGKWKDEGKHINNIVNLNADEKIVRIIVTKEFKEGLYIAMVSKNGQVKRTPLKDFEATRYSRPITCMRLMRGDELVDVALTSGNSNLLTISGKGNGTFFNENEIAPLGLKASGVKVISSLKSGDYIAAFYSYEQNEKGKLILVSDAGHERVFDLSHLVTTARLGKMQNIFKSFKSEPHNLIATRQVKRNVDKVEFPLLLTSGDIFTLVVDDFRPTPGEKYAKKNIEDLPKNEKIVLGFKDNAYTVDDSFKPMKPDRVIPTSDLPKVHLEESEEEEDINYEQISIFDDLGD